MFLVSLIKLTGLKNPESAISLGINCTHVDENIWIFEGDLDALEDDGIIFEVLGSGCVDSLGDYHQTSELRKIVDECFSCEVKWKYPT